MRGVLFLVLLLSACAAEAYIGPGAGVSFFGSLWAIVVGIALSLAAVLIWPLRWALRRLRRRDAQKPAASDPDA
jgi:hypothetical protein